MKIAIYARVSTDDKNQDPETQLFALREFCKKAEWEIVGEYVDKARAKDYKHRTQWAQLLKDAHQHKFNCVLVLKLDRAWRHTHEALNTLEDWEARNIKFKSLNDPYIDTIGPMARVMLTIGLAFAEMESALIGERVKAGIARTRAQGNRYGRKSLEEKRGLTPKKVMDALDECRNVSRAARMLKCSRAYIHRSLNKIGTTPANYLGGVTKDSLEVSLKK